MNNENIIFHSDRNYDKPILVEMKRNQPGPIYDENKYYVYAYIDSYWKDLVYSSIYGTNGNPIVIDLPDGILHIYD